MSDMHGEKAEHIAAFCAASGQACLRLDYSGHGASDGRFEGGTISGWMADARAAIAAFAPGPVLLVGSSMGGWIALLLARDPGLPVAGLVGIAAAPDFTRTLPAVIRDTARRDGAFRTPSPYGGEQIFTQALIEDGDRNCLLDGPIPVRCPVRLLHGQQDPDVPWETALRIAARVESTDVRVTLLKGGGHRLSRKADLELLTQTVGALIGL